MGLKLLPLLLATMLAGVLPATAAGGRASVAPAVGTAPQVRAEPGSTRRAATPAQPMPRWIFRAAAPARPAAPRDRSSHPPLPGDAFRDRAPGTGTATLASPAPRRPADARVRRQPESRPPPGAPIAA